MAMIAIGMYFILCAVLLFISPSGTVNIFRVPFNFGDYQFFGVLGLLISGVLLFRYGVKYEATKKSNKRSG